jgi:hypothetical protein
VGGLACQALHHTCAGANRPSAQLSRVWRTLQSYMMNSSACIILTSVVSVAYLCKELPWLVSIAPAHKAGQETVRHGMACLIHLLRQ